MDRDHVDTAAALRADHVHADADAEAARGDRAARVRVLVWQARAGSAPPAPRLLSIEPGNDTHVPCDNPGCRGGGLDPLPLVRELIDAGVDELRVTSCEGRFDSASNGRGPRCDTMYCVSLAAGHGKEQGEGA